MWIDTTVFQEDMEYIFHSDSIEWDKLKNAAFFITGGTGLIGSTIIRALFYASKKAGLNLSVLALVRDEQKAERMFSSELQEGCALNFVCGSAEQIPVFPERIDYIIHGASPTASNYFVNHPVETLRTAVFGMMNLLELAREKQVRGIVYLSSMEAYGRVDDEQPLTEDRLGYIDPRNVRSSYSEGKRTCETICASYASEYEIPVKVVRLAQTFGPGVAYDDKRVFAMMARCALEKTDIRLLTRGTSRHPYLYTAQAVTGILTVLLKGEAGQVYNVANPETYCSIYEMGRLVADQIAQGTIDVLVAENDDCGSYPPPSFLNLDISAVRALGWHPDHDLLWMYQRLMKTM